MTKAEASKRWSNYERKRFARVNGSLPSRQTLEWLGHTVAARLGETVQPYRHEGESTSRATSRFCHAADMLAPVWGQWLRLRWRLERVLVYEMIQSLHAKGVPRSILEICMPVKGKFLSGLLSHCHPRFYSNKTEERLEREIIKALRECPESLLYRGGQAPPPSEQELAAVLAKLRAALSGEPELLDELRDLL